MLDRNSGYSASSLYIGSITMWLQGNVAGDVHSIQSSNRLVRSTAAGGGVVLQLLE
jgi:hypothetical protein